MLLVSCNDDPKPENPDETTNSVQAYYSYKDSVNAFLWNEDTITVSLTDTLSFRVDLPDTTLMEAYYISSDFSSSADFNDKGAYQYQLNPQESGVYGVYIVAVFKPNEENIDYQSRTYYFHVPTIDYQIFRVSSPVYTIDTDNENLKAQITTELDENYNQNWRPLTLMSHTKTGGTYQLKISQGASGTGTFTTSNAFDLTDVTFSYNDIVYRYSLTKETGSDNFNYLLRQDLTNEFKAKYSDQTIREVSLSFEGLVMNP